MNLLAFKDNSVRQINLLIFTLLICNPTVWAMSKRPPVVQTVESPIQTISLSQCYEMALRRSETIAMKREEIEKTKGQWLMAAGDGIGDIDFQITDSLQEVQKGNAASSGSSSTSTSLAPERRERKFVISQPLFRGFKSLGAIIGAGNLKEQRIQQELRERELLFLDLADAYFTLLSQQKDVEIIEGIHQLFDERIKDLSEREKIGRSRRSEVVSAQSRQKIMNAQMAQSKGALEIARNVMEFYVGIPAKSIRAQTWEVTPKAAAALPADLKHIVESRPDVQAAFAAVKQAKQAVVVAQSYLWPEITLDSNQYEQREGVQSGIDWDMLFTINIPLGTGGENVGRVKEAVSSWKQSKNNYSLVYRQAELEIKQAYENWTSSADQSRSYEEAVKASEENYRMQVDDYDHNLVNNLEVLAALESLFTTRREANQAQYSLMNYYWQYQTAIGKCCESI